MNTLERLKELNAKDIIPVHCTIPMLIGFVLHGESAEFVSEMRNALPKLLAVADITQKTVATLEKLMGLCDIDFTTTIDGQVYRIDLTKEIKEALRALES